MLSGHDAPQTDLGPDTGPLHPTPQLARARWTDLTGPWSFGYDDADTGVSDGWAGPDAVLPLTITVPFPPESALSGIGDTGFHPVVWYQRRVEIDPAGVGERVLLHLGAVDHRCEVFVNGHRAAEHVGGMTSFAVDLTPYLDAGRDEQTLTVRAVDDPHDLAQPRGKQDWRAETQGIFYERTSGIWQPVWLERVPDVHVRHLDWTSDLAAHTVTATVELSAAPAVHAWVQIALSLEGSVVGQARVLATEQVVTVTVPLPSSDRGRLHWSPERPTLIDAVVQVGSGSLANDQVISDEVLSYVGHRSVEVKDGQFLLNGEPYYLRMVLEQGYWRESHLAAPSVEAMRREVELIKELGFNSARLHQKVEDPRFLWFCDSLGLAVWGEMANAFVWSERACRLLTTEWLDVVRRDRSHPSILAWVPINESWGVPQIAHEPAQQHFASSMYHLTKALDPTRPTMSNEGWEHTESDVWGVHDYTPDADGLRARFGDDGIGRTLTDRYPGRRKVLLGDPTHRGQPIMITEFGGLSYLPQGGERWFGYSTITTEDAFVERLRALVTAIAELPGIAGFCYTQLTDTLQESNGLLRDDRTPKLPVDVVREIISTPSAAIPREEIEAFRRAAERASRGD